MENQLKDVYFLFIAMFRFLLFSSEKKIEIDAL